MEVWACDNPSPNVSLLCKQILPIGPIQNSMNNHRRQISPSKPLCEREDWKDMKALACILACLSPSFSPSPIYPPLPPSSSLSFHSSVCPTSFNLRYSVTVSAVVRDSSAPFQESSPESHEYLCLCSLKKDPQAKQHLQRIVLRRRRSSCRWSKVSRRANTSNKNIAVR